MVFNCFVDGGEKYTGSVAAKTRKEAIIKIAAKLIAKGFNHVEPDYGLEAVFFWAYATDNGVLWAEQPEEAHTYGSHFISVTKSHPFEL